MKKMTIFSTINILLIGAMTACSGSLQLDIPTATPAPEKPGHTEDLPESQDGEGDSLANLNSLESLQQAYEQIYEEVLPSVVSISVIKTVTENIPINPDFPFDFGNGEQQPPEFQQQGAGSGFIWDLDGHIITNNHVVEGADVIRIQFADGTSVLGELIGSDAASDLAVVEVDVPASQLKPIEVADSTAVEVGQIVIAIGNPFQLEGSMTTGVISGKGRSLALEQNVDGTSFAIPDVIQTDAAINPGNSGGVLVDINGRLIGVTTAIESPVRANTGIGYAVPSIIIKKIVPYLIADGSYQQPWIGISGTTLTPEFIDLMDLETSQRGALVIEVTPDSPADEAGLIGSAKTAEVYGQEVLMGGDVIIAADDKTINDFEDLVAFLARYTNVGQTIVLTVLREGEKFEVPLTLAARPGKELPEEPQSREITSAWLGILGPDMSADIAEAMDMDPDTSGVLVQQVTADSPADEAGIQGSFKPVTINGLEILVGGDVITAVNGKNISSMQELAAEIGNFAPGDEITLTILRNGSESEISVTLGERPE